ncbi:MAG: peptidoglycan-binding protein [Rhodospirillaceae bacterium]|nr:peptidoglycan-binding protein [Rhodospirillaceae bacterium]
MLQPLNLGKTVSRSVNAKPDDILKLKSTLYGLGHYKTPRWGITPYPDGGLFDAVEDFQKKNKLKVDGVLKPSGPTQNKINKTLTMPGRQSKTSPYLLANTGEHGRVKDGNGTIDKIEETRLALGPGAAPLIAGGIRLAPKAMRELSKLFAMGEAARKAVENGKEKKGKASNERTSINPPPPPTPPSEPPKEKDKLPNRTNFPADDPKLADRMENIPPKIMPVVEIFPELDDELKNADIIIESKGNTATKAELDRIRDYYIEKGWEHTDGGRDQITGKEITEYWIGGPGKAFPDNKGDGRQGGKRTDLTFRKPDGTIIHIQSVDVDKNGKPTQREQDNAYRIFLRTEGEQVILHPKGAQLKRLKK